MVIKKLQKSGNAYSVYLPIEWARNFKDKKVNLEITPAGTVEISPVGAKDIAPLKKSISIKSKNIDFIIRHIASLYIDGYDEFTLNFEKPFHKKTMSRINSALIKRGISQYVVDFTQDYISFKIPPGFLSPMDLGSIMLKRVLKLLISIELGEKDAANNYRKEYLSTMLVFQRLYNTMLRKPHILREFNINSIDVLNLLFILYSAKEIGDWILQDKGMDENDIKIAKQVVEILLQFLKNKNFKQVQKISELKERLSDKMLFLQVKIIERTLLNWSLI